jgi:hypothetical protein
VIGKFLTSKQQLAAMAIGIAIAMLVIFADRGSILPWVS